MRLPMTGTPIPMQATAPIMAIVWRAWFRGPAMQARWQQSAQTLPADHPAWALEAHYLALGLANIVTVLSPQRIIMGGGVMDQAQLFPMIQEKLQMILNGYVATDPILNDIGSYVVPPVLGLRAGRAGRHCTGAKRRLIIER
jgi:fructokinase